MLTFTEFLNEGKGFEFRGSKYSSGFGRYSKDGKSISKEEYLKTSQLYKDSKKLSIKETPVHIIGDTMRLVLPEFDGEKQRKES